MGMGHLKGLEMDWCGKYQVYGWRQWVFVAMVGVPFVQLRPPEAGGYWSTKARSMR